MQITLSTADMYGVRCAILFDLIKKYVDSCFDVPQQDSENSYFFGTLIQKLYTCWSLLITGSYTIVSLKYCIRKYTPLRNVYVALTAMQNHQASTFRFWLQSVWNIAYETSNHIPFTVFIPNRDFQLHTLTYICQTSTWIQIHLPTS